MKREQFLHNIEQQFKVHPVCALLGARQVGKTTLARMYIERAKPKEVEFFDLEDPLHLARLENPMLTLSRINKELIVIDEIQRRAELFPIIRVLVDRPDNKQKFLVLGSASRDLIRQSSETLAGRIGYIELSPFSLDEAQDVDRLWLRGGFPRAYLAENEDESYLWRQSYIATFLERDIPALGFIIPPEQLRRFWLTLAHYHGQIFNGAELARSFSISEHMVRKYLDILIGTFMIRSLTPWFENIGKRQVKSPKIYFRDSGILHALLGIKRADDLYHFPKLGTFWEGFALEEIILHEKVSANECFFWNTHSGAELDLLILKEGKKIGYEVKYTESPKITLSMKIALEDLKLDHLYIVYPGNKSFPLANNITAIPVAAE